MPPCGAGKQFMGSQQGGCSKVGAFKRHIRAVVKTLHIRPSSPLERALYNPYIVSLQGALTSAHIVSQHVHEKTELHSRGHNDPKGPKHPNME